MQYKKAVKIKYPKNLKKAGRKFYRKVLSEFVFTDHHDIERLKQAAACLDEIALAEQANLILKLRVRFTQTPYQQTP